MANKTDIKKQKAKEYCENKSFSENKYLLSEEAFKAGWEAALDYLSRIPWDEAVDMIVEHIRGKEEKK